MRKYLYPEAYLDSEMFLFGRRDVDEKIERVEENARTSFGLVRRDTQTLFQWVQYLNEQLERQMWENRSLRQKMSALEHQFKAIPNSKEEIRRLIDAHYSVEPLMQRVRTAEERIRSLEDQRIKMLEHMSSLPERILSKVSHAVPSPQHAAREPQKASAPAKPEMNVIQEQVMRRIAKNSKEYVKTMIRRLIHQYERISALQLREIVVEQQSMCSKSSFYRMLEEIEQGEDVAVVSQGKEKVYLSKAQHSAVDSR